MMPATNDLLIWPRSVSGNMEFDAGCRFSLFPFNLHNGYHTYNQPVACFEDEQSSIMRAHT